MDKTLEQFENLQKLNLEYIFLTSKFTSETIENFSCLFDRFITWDWNSRKEWN